MKTDLRRFVWVFPVCTLLFCACDVHKQLGEMHYREGMTKFDRGDYTNSLPDFTAAIAQNPRHAYAYLYRGYDLMMASNYPAALKDIDQAISLGRGDGTTYIYRGYCLQGLGDTTNAVTNYSEAIRLEPSNAEGFKFRGILLTTMQDYDGALADLDQAESLDAKDGEIFGYRAALHVWRREFEAAETDATKAIALDGKDDYALLQRGQARIYLHNYTGAVADYNAVLALDSNEAEAYAGRGEARVAAGDYTAAAADLTRATQLNPTNLTALVSLAYVKKKTGDPAGALPILTAIAGLAPKIPMSFHNLGCGQSDLRQYGPALKSFRRAIELDPKTYYSRYRIWFIRSRQGEADAATAELKADLATRGDDGEHAWELCISRFLTGDLPETSFIDQAVATAKRPTDVTAQQCEAYYYAGTKHLVAGDKPGAVELFEKCLATKEDNYLEYFSAQVELRELKQ